MRRRTIDEGGTGGAEAARMADRSAGPLVVAAGESALDVVLIACGHAKAHHVDEKLFAFLSQRFRQAISVQSGYALGKLFGN
jgi:hypothetical protein